MALRVWKEGMLSPWWCAMRSKDVASIDAACRVEGRGDASAPRDTYTACVVVARRMRGEKADNVTVMYTVNLTVC